MGTKFSDYVAEVERTSTPEELAELEMFRAAHRRARALRERREALRMTQGEVGVLAGIDQAEVSRLEGAKTNASAATYDRVAAALGAEWRLIDRPEATSVPV